MTEPNEPNEIDEFAGLAPAPPAKSPILALVIIGLAAATIFHLRDELRYAVSARAAAPIEQLRGAGEAVADRYVVVRGVPDRRNSLNIEPRGEKTRDTFFRLLDADPPIFVRAHATTGRTDLSDSWSGRLRRFKDTPYATSLRDYFARGDGAMISRNLELASFRASLGGGPVRDRLGRTVEILADRELSVQLKPTEYALELPRDKFPKQDDAQHELERVLLPLGIRVHPLIGVPDSFRFATPMLESDTAKRNALFAVLEKAEIDITTETPVISANRSAIRLDGDKLVVGDNKCAWTDVRAISFQEPLRVDDEALVLTEGEAPAGFLWAPLVAGVLLLLAAFNVWYLLKPRRAA